MKNPVFCVERSRLPYDKPQQQSADQYKYKADPVHGVNLNHPFYFTTGHGFRDNKLLQYERYHENEHGDEMEIPG